ncbi:MAG: Clp1/GlmU family protein [Desulfurococcaceae archaeon]
MSVSVKVGRLDVHGKVISEGESFVVHKARNYVATAVDLCDLDITLISEEQVQRLDSVDPYKEKKQIVQDILSKGLRRVAVLGCTDCGKTSLITLMLNTMLSSGIKAAVIDSDIGQADIGPPGFVSLGYAYSPVYWVSEVKPNKMVFIGDVKPQAHTWAIISGVRRLVEVANKDGFHYILLDTDGWVKDERAIDYKNSLIEMFRPDAIIVVGEELKGLFARYSEFNISVYEVRAPVHRKVRSREERRNLRSSKYSEFLEGAPIVKSKINSVIVQGLPLLHGLEVNAATISNYVDGKVLYASRLFGSLNLYGSIKGYSSEELKRHNYERVKLHQYGVEKGLYCAVGQLGEFDYPCIIEKFNFETREVLLRTKYTGKVEVLKVSKIKLTPDYNEEYVEV